MENKQKIVLKLDASYKVKHEKYKAFTDSFFRNVYQQAAKNVKEIIDTTKSDLAYRGQEEYTEPISSLITFDGKRGSGKTSAMLSFCDFLRDFNRIDRTEGGVCGDLLGLNREVSFTVLECIDATLMTDSKELLGAILGKMHTAIEERERSNAEALKMQNVDVRRLKTRLGEIYCSLKAQDIVREETSPGEVLEQLSRSWNQQQAFRDSVRKFNKYMAQIPGGNYKNYLVIPIDDVDMNLNNGYELLEAIRKYMMVPNVIVLLAADDEQLETICVKAYQEGISGKDFSTLPNRLALEYLEKLIPSGRRIYMPDLYREENLYDKEVYIMQEGINEQTVKNTILLNVWKYTGIILNKDYENSHWLQPQSLRKLSNYLNSMHSLSESKESEMEESNFYHNINWFYEDLIRRYLSDEQGKYSEADRESIFGDYIETLREFENAISANKLQGLGGDLQEGYGFKLGNSSFGPKYSYGDLLVILYKLKDDKNVRFVYHTTSLILSLQMRRLLFPIENTENNPKGYAEILEFSKRDFWGKADKTIWLDSLGKPQQSYHLECEVAVDMMVTAMMNQDKSFSMRNVLLLAIQLGLYENEEGKCVGSLILGDFVNCIFDYETKINNIAKLIREKGKLTDEQKEELEAAKEQLVDEFRTWQATYNTTRVLPFDSAEFMFAIFDKLYGDSGVFQAFQTENQYAEMYKEALDVIAETLASYDNYFKDVRSKNVSDDSRVIMNELKSGWSYKDVYEQCPFIQHMRTPEVLNSIIPYYISLFKKPDNPANQGGGQNAGSKPANQMERQG